MLVAESILITCKTEGCENTFRFVPRQQFNSTIRVKQPEYCQCCTNRMKFAKAKPIAQRVKPIDKQKLLRGRKWIKPGKVKIETVIIKTVRTKWYDKSTNQLLNHVQYKICNRYIRMRDAENFKSHCISCNTGFVSEAGHFLAIGSHPEMRLFPHNIHGQCHKCNSMPDGNQIFYERGLISRYGHDYIHQLRQHQSTLANSNTKLMRHQIIAIGRTYQYLTKNKIWVFTLNEFNLYMELIKE